MLGSSKGQFFLIAAVIFLLYFAATLFYSTRVQTTQGVEVELMLQEETLKNFEREQATLFTYFYNNASLLELVKNFTLRAQKKFGGEARLGVIFLLVKQPLVKANQQQSFNASLLNLWDDVITSINLTFNQTTQTKSLLQNSELWKTSFPFSVSSDTDQKLYLSFTHLRKQSFEVEIPFRIGKEKKIGFWVVALWSENFLAQKIGIGET